MRAISLYLHIHQPIRYREYSIFDVGNKTALIDTRISNYPYQSLELGSNRPKNGPPSSSRKSNDLSIPAKLKSSAKLTTIP